MKNLTTYRASLDKIFHGDCLAVLRTLPDNYVDLVVTDPPYQIDCMKAGGNNELTKKFNRMDAELSELNILDGFDNVAVVAELMRICKNINMYFFCNKAQLPMYFDIIKQYEASFDLIKWVKTNPVPAYNNKYMSDTEYCVQIRKNAYCQPANYKDASTLYHAPINMADKKQYEHPTIKPMPLIEKLIKTSSKPGQIILDPFMGSGTTCVAAKKLGRQYIGIELVKKYFDIASKRIDKQQTITEGLGAYFG